MNAAARGTPETGNVPPLLAGKGLFSALRASFRIGVFLGLYPQFSGRFYTKGFASI